MQKPLNQGITPVEGALHQPYKSGAGSAQIQHLGVNEAAPVRERGIPRRASGSKRLSPSQKHC
jgi:hypothetical protein